jgi:hypothetical protein
MNRFLLALLILCPAAVAQDAKPAAAHTSTDPRKCKKCVPAYEKALAYLKKNLNNASFPAKMVAGWLFLADNARCGDELKIVLREAIAWEQRKGNSQHAQNWYPALAGMFLAEYHKYAPTKETLDAMDGIVKWFAKHQERTGGWFKWYEGAYKDRLDYPVKDLGILTAIAYGFLWSAKTHKVAVPDEVIKKADACLLSYTTGEGISYGTPQQGGDPTGARGAFCNLGLLFAGKTDHKIWKTYEKSMTRKIPKMDQGHHIGAFHCLGVVLGNKMLGPQAYGEVTAKWLDHYIGKQEADGTVYIGDDGDAGGEKGLIGGSYGSTAAFALMILCQDAKVLVPPKRGGTKPAPTKPEPKKDEPKNEPSEPDKR